MAVVVACCSALLFFPARYRLWVCSMSSWVSVVPFHPPTWSGHRSYDNDNDYDCKGGNGVTLGGQSPTYKVRAEHGEEGSMRPIAAFTIGYWKHQVLKAGWVWRRRQENIQQRQKIHVITVRTNTRGRLELDSAKRNGPCRTYPLFLTLTHFDFSSCLYVCFVEKETGARTEIQGVVHRQRGGGGGRG